MFIAIILGAVLVVFVFLSGIRVIRPTTRGLIERLVNEAADRNFIGNAQLLKHNGNAVGKA